MLLLFRIQAGRAVTTRRLAISSSCAAPVCSGFLLALHSLEDILLFLPVALQKTLCNNLNYKLKQFS